MNHDEKIRFRMKDPVAIQRAHDALYIVLADPAIRTAVFRGDGGLQCYTRAHLDVLCWVLGHTHNDTFAKNLLLVEEALAVCDYELVDSGDLHDPTVN